MQLKSWREQWQKLSIMDRHKFKKSTEKKKRLPRSIRTHWGRLTKLRSCSNKIYKNWGFLGTISSFTTNKSRICISISIKLKKRAKIVWHNSMVSWQGLESLLVVLPKRITFSSCKVRDLKPPNRTWGWSSRPLKLW